MSEITKRCSKCGESKLLSEFNKDRSSKDGFQHRCRQCRSNAYKENKELVAEQGKRWIDQNQERYRKWKIEYYQKNRDRLLEQMRQYNIEHHDEIAEYQCEYYRQYKRKHRKRYSNHELNRRARKRNANGYDYTTAEHIEARCEVWGNKCYICGAPMEAVDHVKPLAAGGAHWPCNLRPVCKSCNSSKGAKWPYAAVGVGMEMMR